MKVQSPITEVIPPAGTRFVRSAESVMYTAAFLGVGSYLAIQGTVSWEVFVATLGGLGAVATHAAHTRTRSPASLRPANPAGDPDEGSGS